MLKMLSLFSFKLP